MLATTMSCYNQKGNEVIRFDFETSTHAAYMQTALYKGKLIPRDATGKLLLDQAVDPYSESGNIDRNLRN